MPTNGTNEMNRCVRPPPSSSIFFSLKTHWKGDKLTRNKHRLNQKLDVVHTMEFVLFRIRSSRSLYKIFIYLIYI